MAKLLMLPMLLLVAAALLAGCEPAPMVEFTTPGVMMHVEGQKIENVQAIRGTARAEKVDDKFWRVDGTGQVRVVVDEMDTHVVEVDKDKIRVHGVDVAGEGTMREVFVESKAVLPRQVHLDKVKK